jgi:hypothetical protein
MEIGLSSRRAVVALKRHSALILSEVIAMNKTLSMPYVLIITLESILWTPNLSQTGSAAASEVFDQIEKWLSVCAKDHIDCPSYLPTKLPTRVIDVGICGKNEFRDPHLVQTCGKMATYITLSHCWGQTKLSQLMKTTKANIDERMVGIPLSTMPKSFQDAILIARKLRFRYIWIDALCIIQDDAEDWEKEAATMHIVYDSAFLNVAASSAENSAVGMLGKRQIHNRACQLGRIGTYRYRYEERAKPPPANPWDRQESPENVFLGNYTVHVGVAPPLGSVEANIVAGPLAERGWVLQERIFSNRILHYGTYEVLWECNTTHASETSPWGVDMRIPEYEFKTLVRGVPKSIHDPVSHRRETLFPRWYELIESYTYRKFTKASDNLPAIRGLAEAFTRCLGHDVEFANEYLLGLWRSDIARGLAWHRSRTRERNGVPPKFLRRYPIEKGHSSLPSWSWAAHDGLISWSESKQVYMKLVHVVRVHGDGLRLSPTPQNGISYSLALVGYLHAFSTSTSGHLHDLASGALVCGCSDDILKYQEVDTSKAKINESNLCLAVWDEAPCPSSRMVWGLKLSKICERPGYDDNSPEESNSLILDTTARDGQFSRLGFARLPSELWKDSEERKLELV